MVRRIAANLRDRSSLFLFSRFANKTRALVRTLLAPASAGYDPNPANESGPIILLSREAAINGYPRFASARATRIQSKLREV
jgi:hypothetical protein